MFNINRILDNFYQHQCVTVGEENRLKGEYFLAKSNMKYPCEMGAQSTWCGERGTLQAEVTFRDGGLVQMH
jgi:hypothetical protein